MKKSLFLLAEAGIIIVFWLDIVSFAWMDIAGALTVIAVSLAYYLNREDREG